MAAWVTPLVMASGSWALAEVLTDMCVAQDEEAESDTFAPTTPLLVAAAAVAGVGQLALLDSRPGSSESLLAGGNSTSGGHGRRLSGSDGQQFQQPAAAAASSSSSSSSSASSSNSASNGGSDNGHSGSGGDDDGAMLEAGGRDRDSRDRDSRDRDSRRRSPTGDLPLINNSLASLVPTSWLPTKAAAAAVVDARNGKLGGEQATLVAALTMIPCSLVMWLFAPCPLVELGAARWWIAMLAGSVAAIAGLLLYKAYEQVPSTVIVPLVQLTAVMVVPVSTVVAMLSDRVAIFASEGGSALTGKDLAAYIFIMLGGFYPATHGKLYVFFEAAFWKQGFVLLVLGVDLLYAFNNQMTELCTSPTLGMTPEHFMIIQTIGMVLVYGVVFSVVPLLRTEALLLPRVRTSAMAICVLSEALNFMGFWLASYGYKNHGRSNIGIINAAEVALIQIMNLIVAVLARKVFGLGRHTSVQYLRPKIIACMAVTVGIALASMNTSELPPIMDGNGLPLGKLGLDESIGEIEQLAAGGIS